MNIARTLAAAVVCLAALPGVATAAERPSWAFTEVDAWTFVPVVNDGGGSAHVDGFVALRDKLGTYGDNIVAIWYKRPAVAGGAWETLTWESTDQ